MRLSEITNSDNLDFFSTDDMAIQDRNDDAEVTRKVLELAQRLAEFIEQECRPFLQESHQIKAPMYRGVKRSIPFATFAATRKERRPLDSSPGMHAIFNRLIAHCGKTANRSNSAFCTGDHKQATRYGVPYVIIPMGGFHYTWDQSVKDWWGHWNHQLGHLRADQKLSDDLKQIFCNNLRGDDGTLAEAIESGQEIMISCDRYLMVNSVFWEDAVNPVRQQQSPWINPQDYAEQLPVRRA